MTSPVAMRGSHCLLLLGRAAEPDRLGGDERRQERPGRAALARAAREDRGVEQAEPEAVVLLVDVTASQPCSPTAFQSSEGSPSLSGSS